jgi:hypothetical protein
VNTTSVIILVVSALILIAYKKSADDCSSALAARNHKLEEEKKEEISELNKKLCQSKLDYDAKIEKKKKELAELNHKMYQTMLDYDAKLEESSAEIESLKKLNSELQEKLNNVHDDYQNLIESNTTSMPWLAGMMADFLTLEIEHVADDNNYGHDYKRLSRVSKIREIREEAKEKAEIGKEAIYKLEYLRQLFPNLDDYFENDYREICVPDKISEYDPVRDYLSKEEWDKLSTVEKNQLALDRYVESRKSNWQIGRDYELSVAYEYILKGFNVDTFGSYMKLEDHGRDVIAKKDSKTYIIQCKYWSSSKEIHEKHIYQLYGTVVSYCIENNESLENVTGVFVTNITLTDFAMKAAKYLGIKVAQNHELKDFPRIKCNVGHKEYGGIAKIYHLPMDAQYDRVKICKKDEFYAFTVAEAEAAGFRRAYKWSGY